MINMRKYFDFCSEQIVLSSRNLIDENVWEEWIAGMKYFYSLPVTKFIWNKLIDELKENYKDLYNFKEKNFSIEK